MLLISWGLDHKFPVNHGFDLDREASTRSAKFIFASMESVRQQKVSRLIQKELSALFLSHFSHLSDGNMVSITVVRVTPDLSFARVYLSVFPAKEPKAVVENYNKHLHEISHELYRVIRNQFRKMPELRFYHDDSLDYAARIDQLLKDD